MLADSHFYFHKAADVLGLPDKVRTILLTPHRTVKVGITIEGGTANYSPTRVSVYSTISPAGL